MRISFYPNRVFDWPNPFWRILRSSLQKYGVEVVETKFSIPELFKNKKKIKNIHFHYVYPDFSCKRFPKKIRDKINTLGAAYQNKVFGIRLKVARRLGYRIIYTVHNLEFHDSACSDARRNLNSLYRAADSIVVMGGRDRQELKKLLGRKEIAVVPFFHYEGIYKNRITKSEAREKLKIASEKFVYLFFGTLRRYKGVDILIRAFKELNSDSILLIAGEASQEPEYMDELKQLAGDSANIKISEKMIPDNEIQTFMNAADIAVFPFRRISNSTAVILAKSFYKPTICMDRGNIRDYTNPKTDILVKNEDELMKALFEAPRKKFPAEKKEYLKGIPGPEEAAGMYEKVYKK